jgi:hypothetical protein
MSGWHERSMGRREGTDARAVLLAWGWQIHHG